MNTSGSGAVRLSELLSPATIKLNLASAQRDDVLQELVGQLPELAGRPEAREALLRALREREQLHSTGIGGGIALPHARNALAGVVDRAVIVFGRHTKGIAYGAVDGIPGADQKHLFQVFYRGSNVGQIPGTGLGLLIV